MPTFILLNLQVHQAPKSVMMHQRVHYFYDLDLSYFYSIEAMSWIIDDYLQWARFVKTKGRVYMGIKKQTSAKLSWSYNLSLAKWQTPIFSLRLEVLEIFGSIFHFSVLFLCIHQYCNFTLTLLVILMTISDSRQVFCGMINTFPT